MILELKQYVEEKDAHIAKKTRTNRECVQYHGERLRLKLFRFLARIAELTESSGLLKSVLQTFSSTKFASTGDEHLRNRVRFKFHHVFSEKYQRTRAQLMFARV